MEHSLQAEQLGIIKKVQQKRYIKNYFSYDLLCTVPVIHTWTMPFSHKLFAREIMLCPEAIRTLLQQMALDYGKTKKIGFLFHQYLNEWKNTSTSQAGAVL